MTVKRTQVTPLDPWEIETMKKAQINDFDLKHLVTRKAQVEAKPAWSDVSSANTITKAYWAQWDSLVLQGIVPKMGEDQR